MNDAELQAKLAERKQWIDQEKGKLRSCQPRPLSIDAMGWQAFLTQWNREYMQQFIKNRLEFGWYPKYVSKTKKERENQLQKYGLNASYLEIFEPLSEPHTEEKINARLEKIEIFAAAAIKDGQSAGDAFVNKLIQESQEEMKKGAYSFIAAVGTRFTFLQRNYEIDDTIIANGGLFQKPATQGAITAAERRLQEAPPVAAYGPANNEYVKKVIAEAENLLAGKQFRVPKSYKDFLLASNGWLMSLAPLTALGRWGGELGQELLPVEQLTYFSTDFRSQDLFTQYPDDAQYRVIPTSILLSAMAIPPTDIVTLMDFGKSDERGEHPIHLFMKGVILELAETYPNFKTYMETQYLYSIADVRCEYLELQEMRQSGEWKPLNQR